MTPQAQIKATLEKSGIPYKQIDVYGSQIVVTAWSETAVRKWESLIKRFATVKAVRESLDYCKENKNTVLLPSAVKVWRVWGTI